MQRIYTAPVANAGVPPTALFRGDDALSGDASQDRNDGSSRRTGEVPRDPRHGQLAAVMQQQRAGKFDHTISPGNGDYGGRNGAKRSWHRGGSRIFGNIQGNSPSICHCHGKARRCWSWHRAAAA